MDRAGRLFCLFSLVQLVFRYTYHIQVRCPAGSGEADHIGMRWRGESGKPMVHVFSKKLHDKIGQEGTRSWM